jgi:hypothetical protein
MVKKSDTPELKTQKQKLFGFKSIEFGKERVLEQEQK